MPGLQRIILIDTHLSGRVELKLNGHTNICGTNASGKTTLQRLVPVFYGEYPSRVVPATRDSFERWYLPRESSFIIYEYKRYEGDLCQVVLASNGTGVQYRLVAKPFELDDYLFQGKPGEYTSQTMVELGRYFKRQNILVSNLLNTKEFRGIVQNDRTLLTACANQRELLGYARMFSLCQPGQHMRHIEKLAKAVHSKEGKMETIKAMVAAILEEDGVQTPSSSLKPTQVEAWIKECQLIQEFDAIRPEFGKLQAAEQRLQQNEQRLSGIKIQLDQDVALLATSLTQLQDKLEGLVAEIKLNEANWNQQRDKLNQTISVAKADAGKFERELQQIEAEYDNWQAQDVEALSQNLQLLPQWLDEQETLSGRYQLLTEKHQDIESAYNRRLAEVKDKLALQLDELRDKQHLESENKAKLLNEQQLALQQVQSDFQQEQYQIKQNFSQQAGEFKEQKAQAQAALQNAGFTEFEQSQLSLQENVIREAVSVEDSCRQEVKLAEVALKKAQEHRSLENDKLGKLHQAYLQQEQAIKDIETLLYPGHHSLLEYLRSEKPGWEQDLGKVIQPALLQRSDLKPKLEPGTSLYGLQLDLAAVDLPDYAQSETQLRQELELAQEQLGTMSEQQSQQEQLLSKANECVRDCELDIAKLNARLNSAENTRKRAQHERDELLGEFQQALADRKLANKAALQKLKQKLEKLDNQQQVALAELEDRFSQLEMEQKFHWQQRVDSSEERLQQTRTQIDNVKYQAEQDEIACKQFLQDELAQRGVDVDEIGRVKKQLDKLKKDIQLTQNNRHKVQDYQRWLQQVFNGHKVTWQQQLAQARKTQSEAERQLQQEQDQYQHSRQSLKQSQQEAERQQQLHKQQHDNAQRILRALQKLPLPQMPVNEALGMAGNVAQRLSESDELLHNRNRLLEDIRDYVEHFDRLIAAQSGTGLSDIWEHARSACSHHGQDGVPQVEHRKLVSHLDKLLNEVVPQKLNGLKEQGRIFGADLTQYFHVLADIDKRILGQSKRITKEVEEELFLDGVSDSAVKIGSRITELEFWPELRRFSQLYSDWLAAGANQLPNEEYGSSMRTVLDILGRAALSGGISRLLDIELHLKEGNSELVIRTDRQLNESSSHGMAYLILCKFLLAFTRLLRGHSSATIHWPIDELGTLHHNNVKKIFDACEKNNIHVLGAFPNPDSEVLNLFSNRYIVDKAKRQLQVVKPKLNPIAEKLKAHQLHKEQRA